MSKKANCMNCDHLDDEDNIEYHGDGVYSCTNCRKCSKCKGDKAITEHDNGKLLCDDCWE